MTLDELCEREECTSGCHSDACEHHGFPDPAITREGGEAGLPENRAALREAIEAELSMLPDQPKRQFEMGAAAAYNWCLAALSSPLPENPT